MHQRTFILIIIRIIFFIYLVISEDLVESSVTDEVKKKRWRLNISVSGISE